MLKFNELAPSKLQMLLINWSRNADAKGGNKLIASLARRMVMKMGLPPYDLVTFGVNMRLDPTRNIAEKRLCFAPSRFDAKERKILSEQLKAGDIFIDIGANIGGYSLWAAKFVGETGRVISLEPQPRVFGRLKANADLNPELPITPLMLAAGEDRTKMMMSISSSNDGEASLAKTEQGGGYLEVDVVPLFEILQSQGVEKIKAFKIDVEGFEESVLLPFFKTAPKSLWPEFIIMERGDKNWKTDLVKSMIGFGYEVEEKLRMNYLLKLK